MTFTFLNELGFLRWFSSAGMLLLVIPFADDGFFVQLIADILLRYVSLSSVDGGDVWLLSSGFLTDCFLTGGS